MTTQYKEIVDTIINRVSSQNADIRETRMETARTVLRNMFLLSKKRRKMSLVILFLVALASYGVYEKFFHLTPAERAKKELAVAVGGVSKYMFLPEGDEPVLATVTDAKALITQQAFFAGSVNGDQLLLYPKNLKAIIWSPSREKIVNVGPIQQQGEQLTPDTATRTIDRNASAVPATLSVEIRNGTGKTGFATKIAEKINSSAGYSVIKVADAVKKDYAKTIVFNRANDDSKKQMASALAGELSGEAVSELPKGERVTDADVLVILGGKLN